MKKIITMVMCSVFALISMFCNTGIKASAYSDDWTDIGNYDISWYNSTATQFHITTPGQLAGLKVLTTGANGFFSGKTIYLDNDIDLSGHNWIPIGNMSSGPFQGTFDGQSHTIKNLTINQPANDYIGLFGFVFNGNIKNVKADVSIVANNNVGGLVGMAQNIQISNCQISGSISGNSMVGGIVGFLTADASQIKGCNNYCNIFGVNRFAGIVGQSGNNGIVIDNCNNYGDVQLNSQFDTSTSAYCAGIVGQGSGSAFSNCSNYGDISGKSYIGGIAGDCYANVLNCKNVGNITGQYCLGGIIADYSNGQTMSNCKNTGEISGTRVVGGIIGDSSVQSINNCYNSGKVTATQESAGGISGIITGSNTTSYCINQGDVSCPKYTGGLAGSISSPTGQLVILKKSYTTGNILNVVEKSGGLVGRIFGGTIDSCYNIGKISLDNQKLINTVYGVTILDEWPPFADRYEPVNVINCFFYNDVPNIISPSGLPINTLPNVIKTDNYVFSDNVVSSLPDKSTFGNDFSITYSVSPNDTQVAEITNNTLKMKKTYSGIISVTVTITQNDISQTGSGWADKVIKYERTLLCPVDIVIPTSAGEGLITNTENQGNNTASNNTLSTSDAEANKATTIVVSDVINPKTQTTASIAICFSVIAVSLIVCCVIKIKGRKILCK